MYTKNTNRSIAIWVDTVRDRIIDTEFHTLVDKWIFKNRFKYTESLSAFQIAKQKQNIQTDGCLDGQADRQMDILTFNSKPNSCNFTCFEIGRFKNLTSLSVIQH